MRIKKYFKIVLLFVTLLGACNWGINIFRDVGDVKMGMQFDREIRKNTKEYPI